MITEPHTLRVQAGSKSYPVFVERGFGSELFESIQDLNATAIFVISQQGLEKTVLGELFPELEKRLSIPRSHFLYLPPGEENKHLKNTGTFYNRMIELGVDRRSLILAAGGGVVGDFAGFIAATILRGVRFVQIPTTLLSAVDASVGGKVAINVDLGKNMVGAFHQPEFVYFNLNSLATLPEREWLCGLAEMAKHAFLESSGRLMKDLERDIPRLRDIGSEQLGRCVIDSIAFKASVVEKDEREEGLRAVLNLGHTTGHAIESVTHYTRFSHGETVSRGLATMLFLSMEVLKLSQAEADRMFSLLSGLGLPMDTAGFSSDELLEHMRYDKKTVAGLPRFVLLGGIGKPEYGIRIDEGAFNRAWQRQRERFG
jgi:3-dehydroquinate synthase